MILLPVGTDSTMPRRQVCAPVHHAGAHDAADREKGRAHVVSPQVRGAQASYLLP